MCGKIVMSWPSHSHPVGSRPNCTMVPSSNGRVPMGKPLPSHCVLDFRTYKLKILSPSPAFHQNCQQLNMGVSHHLSLGSIIDKEWSRISRRRYAAHCALSLLAVGISNPTVQTAYPIAMTWGCAPYCAFAVWLLTQLGAPGIPASQSYCMATTIILLHLHHAATAMGTTTPLPFEFSTTQHSAVHLALSFFVLSELEYHRG